MGSDRCRPGSGIQDRRWSPGCLRSDSGDRRESSPGSSCRRDSARRPSGVGEHMSKNRGWNGSASTDSCAHSDDARAIARMPSRSSCSVSASSAMILVMSESVCWTNSHAAGACCDIGLSHSLIIRLCLTLLEWFAAICWRVVRRTETSGDASAHRRVRRSAGRRRGLRGRPWTASPTRPTSAGPPSSATSTPRKMPSPRA